MVVDSGATSHYFMRMEENLPVKGPSNKIVSLPDSSKIKTMHTMELPFPTLSATARNAHVLPNLTTNLLISVPKLADAGYTTIFHPHEGGVTVSDASQSSKGGEGWALAVRSHHRSKTKHINEKQHSSKCL